MFTNNISGRQVKQSETKSETGTILICIETFFFFLVNHLCVLKAEASHESGYDSLFLVLMSQMACTQEDRATGAISGVTGKKWKKSRFTIIQKEWLY